MNTIPSAHRNVEYRRNRRAGLRCFECDRSIRRGEPYVYFQAWDENSLFMSFQCLACAENTARAFLGSQAMLERDLEREVTMTMIQAESEIERLYPDGPMSESDYAKLAACEQVIAAGIQTFRAVGDALLEIRDEKLYRMEYPTFAEYLRKRWGITTSQGYRLMDAAKVVADLSPIGDILPTNEAQARPLAQLSTAEARQEAWKEAVAAANGNTPTGAQVQAAVERRKEPDSSNVDAWMGEAKPVPEPPAERPDTSGLLRAMEPVADMSKNGAKIGISEGYVDATDISESDYDVVEPREKIPEPPLSWQERALFHLSAALEALRAAIDVVPDGAPADEPCYYNFRERLDSALDDIQEVVDEIRESAMVVENNEEQEWEDPVCDACGQRARKPGRLLCEVCEAAREARLEAIGV